MEFISKKFKYIKLKRYALSNTKKHFKIRNTYDERTCYLEAGLKIEDPCPY